MLKTYSVYRIGKCTECGTHAKTIVWNGVEAESKEEAVNKALESWSYDAFGQAGAMTERDVCIEEQFLDAEFIAEENEE